MLSRRSVTSIAYGALLTPVARLIGPKSGSSSRLCRFVVIKFSLGHTTPCPLSRCRDPENNEEEREGSTLIVFAEISSFPYGSSRDSLRVGTNRAEGNMDAHGGCLLQILGSSDKCHLSPLDGYCALSDSPPSLHALSQLQNAGLNSSVGPTKLYVRVARLLFSLRSS